jgi:hypothetical protein
MPNVIARTRRATSSRQSAAALKDWLLGTQAAPACEAGAFIRDRLATAHRFSLRVVEPSGFGALGEASRSSRQKHDARAEVGEPGGNRTHNPQIKSLLLCQLSYRP